MPIAPSAAAKDSWPARNAKHSVSSSEQHRAQIAVTQTNLDAGQRRNRGCRTPADLSPMQLGRLRSGLNALLQRDGSAQRRKPTSRSRSRWAECLRRSYKRQRPCCCCKPLSSSKSLKPYFSRTVLELRRCVLRSLQTEPLSAYLLYYCLRGSMHLTAPSSALKRP